MWLWRKWSGSGSEGQRVLVDYQVCVLSRLGKEGEKVLGKVKSKSIVLWDRGCRREKALPSAADFRPSKKQNYERVDVTI